MQTQVDISPDFTLEDIRAIRVAIHKRYVNDETKTIDWTGIMAELDDCGKWWDEYFAGIKRNAINHTAT